MIRSNLSTSSAHSDVAHQVARLGPWFHNLHLPDGTQTAPDHAFGDFPAFKWQQIASHLPEDLKGWRALDIGCNAGFYSFELARRGADVLAIDHDEHYLAQARWAAEQFADLPGSVKISHMQVYDLARLDERFDLVLFMGVFYHLRYPLLGLDIVAEKVRRLMVFQTLTMPGEGPPPQAPNMKMEERDLMLDPAWPKMAFIEHQLRDDPTNWWAANNSAVEAMLRSTGMRITSRPGHEIWCCEPDRQNPSYRTWDASELDIATGRGRARD